jgi:tetratricopeptide (TPR) repeat protein
VSESISLQLQHIAQLIRQQQLLEAEQLCRALLKENSQLAEAWLLLSDIAFLVQRWSDAEACLKNALSLKPDQIYYQFALANFYQLTGQDQQAYPELKALAQHSTEPEIQQSYARVCWRLGFYQDSLQAFQRSAAQQQDNEHYVLPLIRALMSLDQLAEAQHHLDVLIQSAKHSGEAALLQLHLQLQHKGVSATLAATRNWLKLYPQHQGLSHLAEALQCIEQQQLSKSTVLPAVQRQSLNWLLQQDQVLNWVGIPTQVLTVATEVAPKEGLWLEAGVFYGRSIQLLAKATDKLVHGFDSFEGLPEDWKAGEKKGSYSTAGRMPDVSDNVRLHQGWFEQSLPLFLQQHQGPVSLLHIDCDLYSSTCTVLEQLADRFVEGSVIIFDDFLGFAGFEQHELKAFEEFVLESGWTYQVIAASVLSREVAIQLLSKS